MEISSSSVFDDFNWSETDFVGAFSGNRKRSVSGFEEDSSSVMEFLSAFLAVDGNLKMSEEEPLVVLNGGNEIGGKQEQSDLGHGNLNGFVDSRPIKRARFDEDATTTTSDEYGGGGGGTQRRVWVKNRSKAWWEQVDSPFFPDSEFKKGFGMSKATFNMICDELESSVTKKDTTLRSAIPVRQRVAVCIWRLATGEALREVSKRFGLGISTCHKLVLEVSTAIRTILMPKFLKWPDEQKMMEVTKKFESISGIPNVSGAVYTSHIPIIAPKVNVGSYFNKRHTERNRKPSYTVTVQGVVDSNGTFTDISVGWPGSLSDDQVLEKSSLYQGASSGGLLRGSWIVGNSGHALRDWLLAPYTNNGLSWSQHAYNEKIEAIQTIAKESFSRMKARWRCLQKRTEMKLQDLPLVIGACCILHNICEMRNDEMDYETANASFFDDEMIEENPVRSVIAMRTRDQLAQKLLHHDHAGTSSFL